MIDKIAAIAALLVVVVIIISSIIKMEIDSDISLSKPMVVGLVVVLVVVVLAFSCFSVIPPNTVGIKFSPFGGVQQTVLKEGFYVKSPLDKIYGISTEVKTVNVEKVTGQTKDAQWLQMSLDIKYRVNKENAFVVFQNHRTLWNVDTQLIVPLTQRAIEKVTTNYNVIDILGDKRNEVYTEIENGLRDEMAKSGIEYMSVTMIDTDAGTAIEKAIEEESVAKKRTETAVQEQERAKVEADTKKINAEASADVKRIEAQGEADANRLLSESLTENVLRKMEMDARAKFGWITVTTDNAIVDTGK